MTKHLVQQQRLFELHKLNLSQTAYRVRLYIAKNMQNRCKAIHKAVKDYNTAARQLDPPRPALDWSKVSHFSFVEEFSLLDDTRNDLREKPWAKPAVRETMRKAQRILRAHEEITNVNREVRRPHTSICDEDTLFSAVLDDLRARNDPIYGEVREYCVCRRAANAHNLVYIQRLYNLEGFSGDRTPGMRRQSLGPRQNEDGLLESCSGTVQNPHTAMSTLPTTREDALPAVPVVPALPQANCVHAGPHPVSLDSMTATETSEIRRDEESVDAEVDEDDITDIAGLVDHMSNIAITM